MLAHPFKGYLTRDEVRALVELAQRHVQGTRLTAVLLVIAGVSTILGLVQLAIANLAGAINWLFLAAIPWIALAVIALVQRHRVRGMMASEFQGSVTSQGVSITDRGVPILHEWSVVRGVEGDNRLLIVWLSDGRLLPLTPG